MAQTTGAMSGAAATISYQSGGTGSYTDISGSSQSVDVVTLTKMTGEAYTFDGSYAVLTVGKNEPLEVAVKVLYTETTTEAYSIMLSAFENGTLISLKWIPNGTTAGADTYTTSVGQITAIDLPAIDASSAGPVMASFTLRCASITHTP
ncbi:hypothetical protein UFOVP107_4 [uncultured Caudovirales phage]|uniref:Uncharacterized protein n=1 Tax=uncultured Caudovirales phage TaxID=2100421 RepID=A0A6J7WTT1_9CAUD|nr:hypothetical protein UFOVP107_4 [uncultured Caudovirales phage]CAB5218663.1 hypothetical protein UFOVP214_47 [uncultured Caudovirales phage]